MRIRCLGALVALTALLAGCATTEDSAETVRTDVPSSRPDPAASRPDGSTDEAGGEPGSPSTTEEPSTTGEATTTEAAPTTTAEPDGSAGHPLPIGTPARIGDYSVTLTAVRLDATAEVKGANSFNPDPTNGQYALASVAVVYEGAEEGTPSFDVSIVLQGGDARQYETFQCGAVVARPSYDAPVLTNGGAAEYDVCFDLPAAATAGATVFAEDQFTFDDSSRVYWAAA